MKICPEGRPGCSGNDLCVARAMSQRPVYLQTHKKFGKRSFGGDRSKVAGGGDNSHTTANEVRHQSRQAIELALQPMVLHRHVLALDVAGFVEALAEPGNKGRIRQSGIDEADHRHCRLLLRARRERPRGYRAAEQRDERAAVHSITSSAVASSVGGRSSPSALAVLRLITNSNLVGCTTGRSPGLAPLRIRPT